MKHPHLLAEDEFVDVPGEHGGGGENGRVGRGHDGGGHGAQSQKGDSRGAEELQAHGQDQVQPVVWNRYRSIIVRGVPV